MSLALRMACVPVGRRDDVASIFVVCNNSNQWVPLSNGVSIARNPTENARTPAREFFRVLRTGPVGAYETRAPPGREVPASDTPSAVRISVRLGARLLNRAASLLEPLVAVQGWSARLGGRSWTASRPRSPGPYARQAPALRIPARLRGSEKRAAAIRRLAFAQVGADRVAGAARAAHVLQPLLLDLRARATGLFDD
jgi:hypothetical protein